MLETFLSLQGYSGLLWDFDNFSLLYCKEVRFQTSFYDKSVFFFYQFGCGLPLSLKSEPCGLEIGFEPPATRFPRSCKLGSAHLS